MKLHPLCYVKMLIVMLSVHFEPSTLASTEFITTWSTFKKLYQMYFFRFVQFMVYIYKPYHA